jgi:hypothetical protein
MSKQNVYEGKCFCGAVTFRVAGEPAAMGYCHCSSCRQWSASPVNAFTLWPLGSVSVTRGAELIADFSKTPNSVRKWCKQCGGHLFTDHPGWQLTDVYSAVLAAFPFEAKLHVNYAETVLKLHDRLPKQRDLPQEMGGSGTLIPD